jgi:hypothetical protein
VIPAEREVNSETAIVLEYAVQQKTLKKEKRMLTSLKAKAAVASEGVFAILETSCQLGNNAVSGRGQVATARRRSHALD